MRERSIFTSFALNSLKANRHRSIASIVGIALSCALLTAIFTSENTLNVNLRNLIEAQEGSWQLSLDNAQKPEIDEAESDQAIDGIYVQDHYGNALLPQGFNTYGIRYLSLMEYPDTSRTDGIKPEPKLYEGRKPTSPNEIVLPLDLRETTQDEYREYDQPDPSRKDDKVQPISWTGTLQLGSTIDLALGRRTIDNEGTGQYLSDTDGVNMRPGKARDQLAEWLSEVQPARTYTVVGFYNESVWNSGAGHTAYCGRDPQHAVAHRLYIKSNAKTSMDLVDIETRLTSHIDERPVAERLAYSSYHEELLRYQGLTPLDDIWGAIPTLAVILTVVVLAASVSLIYNTFAIAVGERTRQYGLLASLGASKRQIRWTVYLEATVLCAIGIPLGIMAGLAGTAAVFGLTAEGIGTIVSKGTTGLKISHIIISPTGIAACSVITMLSVWISAMAPAWRASKVTPIEALKRSRDIRSRKWGLKSPRVFDTLRMKLGGVPTWLAHKNLSRASMKKHVVAASLGASVALIIVTGAIAQCLTEVSDGVTGTDTDILVFGLREIAPQETLGDALDNIGEVQDYLAQSPDARSVGYNIYSYAYAHIPAKLINAKGARSGMRQTAYFEDQGAENAAPAQVGSVFARNGDYYGMVSFNFVDTATWKELLRLNKIDDGALDSDENPSALAYIDAATAADGTPHAPNIIKYSGPIDLYLGIDLPQESDFGGFGVTKDGVQALYIGADGSGTRDALTAPTGEAYSSDMSARPLDQVIRATQKLNIAGTATRLPEPLRKSDSMGYLNLVMPVSGLKELTGRTRDAAPQDQLSTMHAPFGFAQNDESEEPQLTPVFFFDSSDPAKTGIAMQERMQSCMDSKPWGHAFLNNVAEEARALALLKKTIMVFITCFAAATGAIAMVNVFNTITSSIGLRAGEFAMLRSCGMTKRGVARMIFAECVELCIHGLICGIVLGLAGSLLIRYIMSYKTFTPTLASPMAWMAAAICLVVVVLAFSAWYALATSKNAPIIETLREDAL